MVTSPMIETLVTGGTGFIGSSIVRALLKSRESARVLSRDPQRVRPEHRAAGTSFYKGDIFDPVAMAEALKGCNALVIATQFDNAPFENPGKGQTYEHIDGEGTERQVEAAKKAGIDRIIYISGAGTREGRTEPWFRAKLRAENAVRSSGNKWTIFRPSWIYGPTDRSLNKFLLLARISPVVPIIGSGNEKIQPLYVEDLAGAVRLSLNNPVTFEKIFEIGGPEQLTMKEIVKTLLRISGKRRILLPHPKPLMKAIAGVLQHLPLGGFRLTPAGIDFVTMEEEVDNKLVCEALGIALTPLTVGLGRYLLPNLAKPTESTLRRHAA